MASAKEYIDEALSIAMDAMKAAIHSTLGSSPGDIFLHIPLIADWHDKCNSHKRKSKVLSIRLCPSNKGYLRKHGNSQVR
jgi:hypothetical protein